MYNPRYLPEVPTPACLVPTPLWKTYYPKDKDQFLEGTDIWEALNAGREVTLDERGFIRMIWDPITKKTYDVLGNETGTSETGFSLPVPTLPLFKFNPPYTTEQLDEIKKIAEWTDIKIITNNKDTLVIEIKTKEGWTQRIAITPPPLTEPYKTYTPTPFPDPSLTLGVKEALKKGYQVVVDDKGIVISIRDPNTGEYYDINLNPTGNVNTLPSPNMGIENLTVPPTTWQEAERSTKSILKTLVLGLMSEDPERRISALWFAYDQIERESGNEGKMTTQEFNKAMQSDEEDWGSLAE